VTDPDLIGLFIQPLEALGLAYMITGGVASVIYGDPRFTRDVDVVLELQEPEAETLLGGFSSEDYYLPPLEAVREEALRRRHGHFNIIHRDTGLRADVYLMGDDPLHEWAFPRRERVTLDAGTAIWLAPVEYVVLRKLEYFRESGSDRHLQDISVMLRTRGDGLDTAEFNRWIENLSLHEPWEAARSFGR
jgi:hypothetical protein